MNTFYRSKRNKYVGGVCGGLAERTNIDAIVWRLGFIFIPSAIWIYIAICIFTKEK